MLPKWVERLNSQWCDEITVYGMGPGVEYCIANTHPFGSLVLDDRKSSRWTYPWPYTKDGSMRVDYCKMVEKEVEAVVDSYMHTATT